MPRGYLTLSAGPQDAERRRAVRVLAYLEEAPRQEGEIQRLSVLFTCRRTERNWPLACTGLRQKGVPHLFFGETRLPPGEFRLTVSEEPGFGLYVHLPRDPRSSLRLFCAHSGQARSSVEKLAAHASSGGRIVEIGTCRWEACCRERLTASDLPARNPKDMMLFMPRTGTLDLVVDGTGVSVRRGRYLLAPPLSRNYLPRDRQKFPLGVKIVTFSPDFLLGFCQMAGLSEGLDAFSFLPGPHRLDGKLETAVKTLEETLKRNDALAAPHEAYLAAHQLLLTLLRCHRREKRPASAVTPSSREKEAMEKAVTYFRTRYWEPCRITRVAREVGVSVTGLRRIFRRFLNQSPNDFLQAVRIEAAKKLLQDPDRKLSDIAEEVGYADVRNFRRLFKAHTRRQARSFRMR